MKLFLSLFCFFFASFSFGQDLSIVKRNTAWIYENGTLQELKELVPTGEFLGGGFGTKIDYDVQYPGVTSSVSAQNPQFYIWVNTEFGIRPESYVIIKFKAKKSKRIYTRFTSGAAGLDDDKVYTIPLEFTKVDGNIFKFVPVNKLDAGEYGICFIFNCFPTFVYDFTIN